MAVHALGRDRTDGRPVTGADEWYRALVENAMEGIARIGPEGGVIKHCNPTYASILGLTPEEAVGRSFFDFLEGKDKREARRQRKLRLSGVGSRYEVVVTAAHGQRRILLCGGYPLYGSQGGYQGAVHTVTDVTAQRLAEEDLKKSKARFQLVAGVVGEAIWDNDLLTGVQEWDGATEALFGYPPRESRTGGWWEERIHPEDRGRVLRGLAAALDGPGEAWEEGYRFRKADGSYAHVQDRARIVRDGGGTPIRMIGSMRDVTDRVRYEEELRRSEELFRTTFEAAAAGMAHLSPDGRWLKINDKLCEISGYAREELLGTTHLELTPSEDLAAGQERVRRLLAGRSGPYALERRFVRKDGRRVWVNLSVSLVRKRSGEPDRLVCVAEDITARKLRELVPDPLTPQELKVLRFLASGRTNREVACTLSYSLGMIKHHVQRVIAKLEVASRTEAVTRAVDIGLLPPA